MGDLALKKEQLAELVAKCKEYGMSEEDEAYIDQICMSVSVSAAIDMARMKLTIHKQKILVSGSMQSTYGLKSDTFKQPPIKINKFVKPSSGPRERKVPIKREDGEVEKTKMKTPSISTTKDGSNMWIDLSGITIPVEDVDGFLHSSALGALRTGSEPLEYLNEFEVQVYCQNMIRDALRALGLEADAATHLEISIYMMKPDIVIVVKHRGRVFFAAEVKSPELEEESGKAQPVEVFGNAETLGQLWSYLYATKQSGNPCPVGAIMTYNKIQLVSLQDYSNAKTDDDAEDSAYKMRMEEVRKLLTSDRSPRRSKPEQPVECHNRKDSPVKQTRNFCASNQSDGEVATELYDESVEREAFCSRVYESKEVFPCLLQAIELAYRSVEHAESEKPLHLKNGDIIGGRLLFKLGESEYDWVKVRNHVVATITRDVPDSGTKYLYIMGKLGDGGKANVYMVCTSGGRVCAIKDYFVERSSQATQEARDEEEENGHLLLIETAEDEAFRWTLLYGGRFKASARCFGGKYSLLMPYGHALANDRWQYVPDIRDELVRFATKAENRQGYRYENAGLRLRHVLLDSDEKIFFCDLDSLVEVNETENRDDMVYKQLAILLNPLLEKEEVEQTEIENETLQWLRESKPSDVNCFIADNQTLKLFVEGLSPRGDSGLSATAQYANSLCDLFPQGSTRESLSKNWKAVVTLRLLSHYRSARSAKRQRSPTAESQVLLPRLSESRNAEEHTDSKKRAKRN